MNRREFIGGLLAGGCLGCLPSGRMGDRGDVLRIAHCCDPQFGMGRPRTPDLKPTEEGYRHDLERLEHEIDVLNGMDIDLVYFAGDMTHVAADVTRDWPRLLRSIRHRVAVAPGNHDMGNRLTAENADRFVSVFGSEYEAFDLKGWRMIVGNSQYWWPTAETARRAAYERWLEAELARAESRGQGRTILATHIPPFVRNADEPDTWENAPKTVRADCLERCRRAGVRFYLAGHTHTMFQRTYGEMTLLNAETTCDNFDGRPFGFRLLTINPDSSFTWDFQPVE